MGIGYNNLSKTFRYRNELGGEIKFLYDEGFLINKPVGIDKVTVSLSRAQGINQVGETVQSKNVKARPVNISGVLVGAFQEENKEKLLSIVRPDLNARLYADDYYINVSPTETPTIEDGEDAHFKFSLLAPYPYWQKDDNVKTALSGLQYMFRFPVNLTKPYQFAKIIETKFINVENRGQLPIPFRVEFFAKGDCENPMITNVQTGQFLKIKKAMTAGERIIIDITHDRTYVTSSASGSIRGALTLDSNLFRLSVGENILKPEATSGLKQLEVTIDFAIEKVGIAL